MILAHIAGMPIEETALSLGPVLAAGGGIATLKLRERLARRRRRRQTGSARSSCS
jgi:uncharacterized membrane protein